MRMPEDRSRRSWSLRDSVSGSLRGISQRGGQSGSFAGLSALAMLAGVAYWHDESARVFLGFSALLCLAAFVASLAVPSLRWAACMLLLPAAWLVTVVYVLCRL